MCSIRQEARVETRIEHADARFSRVPLATITRARPAARARGFTTISTSLPSRTRNRTSRSSENPASRPRVSAETFGWSISSNEAAADCVNPRRSMIAPMRSTKPTVLIAGGSESTPTRRGSTSIMTIVSPHLSIDRDAVSAFCRRHHITRLALFGSVLRDDFSPDSDVDVLVEFQAGHVPGLNFVSIEREFSALLQGRQVDMVTPKFLNHRIREQVLSSAEPLYVAA